MTARHPIPDAALDDRLGFLGMTGSGKTFGAGTCVERILARRGRAIIPDPLGVWWGLRLLADGKTPSSYEIVIFGGAHADLPLTPHAGALIGETVAGMRESAIIDLSGFETAAAERRFMLAFLDALYRKTAGEPVHLIFDEADLFAPERILDREGEATKLHGMMQTIVRRGRIKGLTSWLISQRPAALSKNVLSQVDGLVAFRLTASQDRKALGLWIEGQADREAGKAILGRLPEKKQGEAVVWLPARGILADVTFPPKETYDSSRAPKRGEKRKAVELNPLDLGALKQRLATVEAEVKANDPRALKARIADLERQWTVSATEAARRGTVPDPVAIAKAEERGFEQAKKKLAAAAEKEFKVRLGATITALRSAGDAFAAEMKTIVGNLMGPAELASGLGFSPAPAPVHRPAPSVAPKSPSRAKAIHPSANSDGALSGPEHRILDAIRWWNVLGIAGPSHPQVAFIAGYSHKSGTWATYLSRLRSMNMIEGRGDLVLTADGAAAANEPDTPPSGDALRSTVLAKLDGPLTRILSPILNAYPDGLEHAAAGEQAGYSPSSGTWATYLSRLRSLDLIEGRGELKAQGWLFP